MTCVTLEIISNLEELGKNSKRKLILKSKFRWSVSKASHTKWPCLPMATISYLKHLIYSKETFDFKIKIHCPISRVMSDSLIEYFIWSVTLKQNKKEKYARQTALTQQIWILLSESDRNHFISKPNFCKAAFEITIDYPRKISNKGGWGYGISIGDQENVVWNIHGSWFLALETQTGVTQFCGISRDEASFYLVYPRVKWQI